MATAAPHPFIRGTKVHGIRREEPRVAPSAPPREPEPVHYETEIQRPAGRRVVHLAGAAAIMVALSGGAYAAYNYGSMPDTGIQSAQAGGVERVELAAAVPAPALVGNRIPDDYPAIYPGEQLVTYHLTPLPGESTLQETDEDGCQWLRVKDKTEGILVYPMLGADGSHLCSDPSLAIQPETARMVGGSIPTVSGSSVRVVQIREAASGKLLAADGTARANSTPFLPNFADQGSTRDMIRQQVAHQLSAGGSPAAASVTSLPSQAAPSRVARISTASDEDANPAPRARTQIAAVRKETQRPDPRPMEPIRRAPAYVPPADDEMVPISQNPNYANDTKVPMTEQGSGLRAIRPGDPPRLPGQRQTDSPAGSPLEGYASISGN